MISPNIELLLLKYFANEASLPELDILRKWIKNPNNEHTLKNYVKTNYLITHNMSSFNIDKAKANLTNKIEREKKRQRLRVVQHIAITIILLAIPIIMYYPKENPNIATQPTHQKLIINDEKITLKLDDGSLITLNDTSTAQIANSEGKIVVDKKGNRLNYNSKKKVSTIAFNELTVPYGKRFEIKLSDGTMVYLNSGSSLKYPETFIPTENRKVFLNGEAFFDIAKNKDRPFIVNNNDLDVKVLGTKFNMSAYPEDNNTDIVLVEGSVKMQPLGFQGENSLILKPGHKGSFNNLEKNIKTKQVNTAIYTSWVKGNIVFRNTSFSNIIKKLERHYNVTIINNNPKLSAQTFNATIEVENETIEDVFFYFNKVHHINYSIENNKIIIN
ncbi:MAG: FecR family protein [Flavobacteriaceae bacterium]